MIDVFQWDGGGNLSHPDAYTGIPAGGWVWVDLVGEDAETIRLVGHRFGLDDSSIDEAIGNTNLPLIEEHPDHVFVVLHGFTHGTGERMSTPEIDVFVGAGFLVTVRDEARLTIDLIKERLGETSASGFESPAELLASTALLAARRYTPLIMELERQADLLEEQALRADPSTIVEAHALRRDIILLRRALSPQFDVYEDLSESTHEAITPDARRLFRRVASTHERALESLEAGRALLLSVVEIYRGAVADQTNEIMRVLTVFSAILLPLSLVAGLWGMNFLRIPGAEVENGFWWLIGGMAVFAIGLWLYFARRGFIGAPRIQDIPKAVGLGLFNIGTAPIRVVAEGIRYLGKPDE
jgi:magnesium transporter